MAEAVSHSDVMDENVCSASLARWGDTIIAEVGCDKEVVHIHRDILAACGEGPLKARLDGVWAANNNNRIDWKAFDQDTVACFLEYLYTGDYNVPGISYEVPEEEDDYERKDFFNPRYASFREHFPDLNLPIKKTRTAAGALAESTYTKSDVCNEILVHTKLYLFANENMFEKVETFALERLLLLLSSYCLDRQSIESLEKVVEYVGKKTGDHSAHEHPIRNMLAACVAVNSESMACNRLDYLLSKGGDFAAEVHRAMQNHAALIQKKLEAKKGRTRTWS